MTWTPDHSFVVADPVAARRRAATPVTDPIPSRRPSLSTARERFTMTERAAPTAST